MISIYTIFMRFIAQHTLLQCKATQIQDTKRRKMLRTQYTPRFVLTFPSTELLPCLVSVNEKIDEGKIKLAKKTRYIFLKEIFSLFSQMNTNKMMTKYMYATNITWCSYSTSKYHSFVDKKNFLLGILLFPSLKVNTTWYVCDSFFLVCSILSFLNEREWTWPARTNQLFLVANDFALFQIPSKWILFNFFFCASLYNYTFLNTQWWDFFMTQNWSLPRLTCEILCLAALCIEIIKMIDFGVVIPCFLLWFP